MLDRAADFRMAYIDRPRLDHVADPGVQSQQSRKISA